MKIMTIFGTRPEAIKLFPIIKALEAHEAFTSIVVHTEQHRELVNDVLHSFPLRVDVTLQEMAPNRTLAEMTAHIVRQLEVVLAVHKPQLVIVHGDTTTTFAAALAAFYARIPVAHIEAGLRSHQLDSPFPEEANRCLTKVIATYHFAPTEMAKQNLVQEGVAEEAIFVTGNSAIDVFRYTLKADYEHRYLRPRFALLTCHRRENLGAPMAGIFRAAKAIAHRLHIPILFPVHLNPAVQQLAYDVLGDDDYVQLIEPLNVVDFHNFIARAHFMLTDSGGIQEEAPHLNVPVFVLRDVTERCEGVATGTLQLVGTDEQRIIDEVTNTMTTPSLLEAMRHAVNPYGDGHTAARIVAILADRLLSFKA